MISSNSDIVVGGKKRKNAGGQPGEDLWHIGTAS